MYIENAANCSSETGEQWRFADRIEASAATFIDKNGAKDKVLLLLDAFCSIAMPTPSGGLKRDTQAYISKNKHLIQNFWRRRWDSNPFSYYLSLSVT